MAWQWRSSGHAWTGWTGWTPGSDHTTGWTSEATQSSAEQPALDVAEDAQPASSAEQPALDVITLAQPVGSAQHGTTSAATQSSAEQPALEVLPLAEFNHLRREVLDPLYAGCLSNRDTQEWVVSNKETPLALNPAYWRKVLGAHHPVDATLISCIATFFENEPDHNRQNKPRLDIVLKFSDGRTVRYHPKAKLIWSDEPQPTEAMQKRFNHAAKLRRTRDTAGL